MADLFELNRQASDHDESFEELVAALALGGLEPDEAGRLRPHLAACQRCRHLLGEYTAVVESLPLSLPEAPANPDLKARLLAAAEAEARPQPAAVSPARPVEPGRAGPAWWQAPVRWRLAFGGSLAALLLIMAGLGWWSLRLQSELLAQQARLEQQERFIAASAGGSRAVLAGTDRAPDASGQVVQPAAGGPPLLAVQGLPPLPPGQVYQIWVIADGQPYGAGLLVPADGTPAIAPLERDLSGVQVVALTPEPAGGSPAPTGPIVLAGPL
jgi:anti-sigma-K factor RskA